VVAETLNVNEVDALRASIPLVQVFVISCNNLANTHEELGQLEEAENMLQRAVYFLLHSFTRQEHDASRIRPELSRACLNYVHFADTHKIDTTQLDILLHAVKDAVLEH
jgi:hypothetical protein